MTSENEMTADQAIELYYEKHHAMRQGDIEKLRELKNKFPAIFDKAYEAEIHDMIEFAKAFQQTDQYKAMCRLQLKEQLLVIDNESTDEEIT